MQQKLKIISFNIWGLPAPFSHDLETRFTKILQFLKDENPDIISLQECWFLHHLHQLKKIFPDYYLTSSHEGTTNNHSGLVVLTKQKPLQAHFIAFERPWTLRIDEMIANKGALLVEIPFREKTFTILNTHTFARSKPAHKKFLRAQLRRIKQIIEKTKNVILAGDLNVTVDEFTKWNNNLLSISLSKNPEFDEKNPYRKYAPFHLIDNGETASYIGVKTNPHKITMKTIIPEIFLSDHQPIITEITFD